MLNELSFYTFKSIWMAVRCMTQFMEALVQISDGGCWGEKQQRRGVTRPRICILLAVFCVLLRVCA
jgi:uncharacterized BrkB/YihY/UPF0761 family membrane protein